MNTNEAICVPSGPLVVILAEGNAIDLDCMSDEIRACACECACDGACFDCSDCDDSGPDCAC